MYLLFDPAAGIHRVSERMVGGGRLKPKRAAVKFDMPTIGPEENALSIDEHAQRKQNILLLIAIFITIDDTI